MIYLSTVGVFHHVKNKQPFRDDYKFYRFYAHEVSKYGQGLSNEVRRSATANLFDCNEQKKTSPIELKSPPPPNSDLSQGLLCCSGSLKETDAKLQTCE